LRDSYVALFIDDPHRGGKPMERLWQDSPYAARMLVKRQLSTPLIIPLALEIGANTGIFSVVSAIILKPLPFKRLLSA
jgi:hypothetical protein